LGRSRHH